MIKNWITKMEWNDKAAMVGLLVFIIVCESERLYLRNWGCNHRKSNENTTESNNA